MFIYNSHELETCLELTKLAYCTHCIQHIYMRELVPPPPPPPLKGGNKPTGLGPAFIEEYAYLGCSNV